MAGWRGLTLIPATTAIPFMRYRRAALAGSLLLLLATLALIAGRGLNLGIDFAGGILIEVRTPEAADLSQLRALLDRPEYGDTSLQHFGNKRDVLIRLEGNAEQETPALVETVKQRLRAGYDAALTFRRVSYVGPSIGAEMLQSGLLALSVAFLGMLGYIWIRFEWQFGVGALLALLHDAALILGVYAATHLEFGLNAIAAMLTVVGYSINDSVVIYDRIRENLRRYQGRSLDEVIDLSLNQTLSRTILTAVTTLLAAGALALLGGEIIHGFAIALCVGVLVGTYSSIYIAAPALRFLHLPRHSFDADMRGKET